MTCKQVVAVYGGVANNEWHSNVHIISGMDAVPPIQTKLSVSETCKYRLVTPARYIWQVHVIYDVVIDNLTIRCLASRWSLSVAAWPTTSGTPTSTSSPESTQYSAAG
jgi:hypothetical protein